MQTTEELPAAPAGPGHPPKAVLLGSLKNIPSEREMRDFLAGVDVSHGAETLPKTADTGQSDTSQTSQSESENKADVTKAEIESDAESVLDKQDESHEIDEPDLSELSEESPDGEEKSKPDRTERRIAKLTAKYREAERVVNELRQKVDELSSSRKAAPQPHDHGSLSDAWTVDDVRERVLEARRVKRWAQNNPDGVVLEGKEISADEITKIKEKAEDVIEQHAPDRIRYLNDYKASHQAAVEAYPWLAKSDSEEYALAAKTLQMLPELKARPNFEVLIGDFLAGRAARLSRDAAKSGKVKPNSVPPKLQAKPQSSIPVPKKSGRADVMQGLYSGGGDKSAIAFFKQWQS